MKHLLLAAAAASLVLPVYAAEPAPVPSPGEIAAAAPASDWIAIAPSDLLVMDLAPDAKGKPRRVVIQLMPAPFSQGWIGNIRKLAAAHWWDGTSINRVQDNYVTQWGDATEKKPLPEGLVTVPESEYVTTSDAISEANATHLDGNSDASSAAAALGDEITASEERSKAAQISIDGTRTKAALDGWHERDSYAPWVEIFNEWPVGAEQMGEGLWRYWPVHCYGAVGVGRNMSPDTGSGAELYTVIGEAPRHLDRNIALIGRVISGMEYLTSLPRGTGPLGFYEDEAQRIPILSVRLGNELPAAQQPKYEILSTSSVSFHRYVDARANRRDPFFIKPAGGVNICNIPVPIRPVAAK
ncbi:peptidylprolyl isomerase [Sphingopyxis sp.]|uniref:peptidylprolyl isomerase n=1 Tax=Sphingopyxis sp. TaxID=1908224 RepID=UPI003D0F20F6